jgi:hypothetical protein
MLWRIGFRAIFITRFGNLIKALSKYFSPD